MPKYVVDTNQGEFEIETDREATQEELQTAIEQQLKEGPPAEPQKPLLQEIKEAGPGAPLMPVAQHIARKVGRVIEPPLHAAGRAFEAIGRGAARALPTEKVPGLEETPISPTIPTPGGGRVGITPGTTLAQVAGALAEKGVERFTGIKPTISGTGKIFAKPFDVTTGEAKEFVAKEVTPILTFEAGIAGAGALARGAGRMMSGLFKTKKPLTAEEGARRFTAEFDATMKELDDITTRGGNIEAELGDDIAEKVASKYAGRSHLLPRLTQVTKAYYKNPEEGRRALTEALKDFRPTLETTPRLAELNTQIRTQLFTELDSALTKEPLLKQATIKGTELKTPVSTAVDNWDGAIAVTSEQGTRLGEAVNAQFANPNKGFLHTVAAERGGVLPTSKELLRAANKMEEVSRTAVSQSARKLAKQRTTELRELAADPTLSTQELKVANDANNYYKVVGERAQKVGVLDTLRENYGGPRSWIDPTLKKQGLGQGRFAGKTPFAKQRGELDSLEMMEKGFIPRTLSLGDKLFVYHSSVGQAVAGKAFRDYLKHTQLLNYSKKGTRLNSPIFSRRFIAKEAGKDVPVFQQAYAEPEVAKVLNNLTDPGFIQEMALTQGMEAVNRFIKFGKLTLSMFHFNALSINAIAKGFNPFTGYSKGLDILANNSAYFQEMLRAGLQVSKIQDFGVELASIAKTQGGQSLIRKVLSTYNSALWERYWTGIKAYSTHIMAQRFIKQGVEANRALELAVQDANLAFGGINLTRIARSKKVQDAFRLMALAPDWTEAQIKLFGGLFGRSGIKAVTSTEKAAINSEFRKFWVRTSAFLMGSAVIQEAVPSFPGAHEAGVKDVIKLFTDPGKYFTSKLAPIPRALFDTFIRKSPFRGIGDLIPVPIPFARAWDAFNKESTFQKKKQR